ncbi:TIGR00341 family protein [Catalinimonas alkaloidigena]|uniref:TIGR00341 family protein n=1 Tax=Catalinimonas alkaloidigena TaxID=1075417 RepID=A0A1G9DBK9_9BACT|nr:TIGR00341 family protein [Catalinimonas alkaloidigena]SDK61281.1 TIGR00341 family protein [Catalinimonas alkaloidigena]
MSLPTQQPPAPPSRRTYYRPARIIFAFLRDLVNLEEDKADELKTIDDIKRGVVFRGTNLWILIFAILIASIGLNVNSTAVIIGAMLISPLMGPIMGIGLGIGINDWELIKTGMKNLAIAATISVLTSTIYFTITPLSDAQSELLARTQPTLWDVLIAIFGGLAGIVAGSRREKSNAVPGVAIATALMPPLCTAGFGLASGNFYYFFGAFYLFFINSVFISLATFVIVRYLKYPRKEFVDPAREKRVKSFITLFVLIAIMPSVYTGYQVVRRSLFERNAQQFIRQELHFPNTQVISHEVEALGDSGRIEVTLFGEPVAADLIHHIEKKLPGYGLGSATLTVHQGYTPKGSIDVATVEQMNQNLKTGIIEELYRKNEEALQSKDWQIALLERELRKYQNDTLPVTDIGQELKVQYKDVSEFSITPTIIADMNSHRHDTVMLAYCRFRRRPRQTDLNRLSAWLKVRTKADSLRLVVQ